LKRTAMRGSRLGRWKFEMSVLEPSDNMVVSSALLGFGDF
jgi:hypothetical protein